MKQAGQITLFRFPHTDLTEGKLRPALIIGRVPGEYDDWLICMISSQTRQYMAGFDEVLQENDSDFQGSGLKVTSVIRVGRLAVVAGDRLIGAIGEISSERVRRVKRQLSDWILE